METTIVIPTFNEKQNIEPMVQRIERSLAQRGISSYEILFVDDSKDDTYGEIQRVASVAACEVRGIHRTNERGLASAVCRGFEQAKGQLLICMDADLQHPPELLPTVIERLREGTDIVIPSRFVAGGSDGGLNFVRKFISWFARKIGQLALSRLRKITDCTGGYFGLQRSVLEDVQLNPIGWKILIEVLMHGKYKKVHEIPYEFEARGMGESKMSLTEQLNYLRHLMRLVASSELDRRFWLFAMVGGSGVILNLLLFILLYHAAGLPHAAASIVASVVPMISNFILNERFTWRSEALDKPRLRLLRLVLFIAISCFGIAITTGMEELFTLLSWPSILGQGVGILVATGWNYGMNHRVTWGTASQGRAKSGVVVTRETV